MYIKTLITLKSCNKSHIYKTEPWVRSPGFYEYRTWNLWKQMQRHFYILVARHHKQQTQKKKKIMLCFSLSLALFTFTTSITWAKVDIFVYTYTREATYRCFYILTTNRTTQNLQTFEENGLTNRSNYCFFVCFLFFVVVFFYVGNVDSMNQCQTVTCLNDSRYLLFFRRLTFRAVKSNKGHKAEDIWILYTLNVNCFCWKMYKQKSNGSFYPFFFLIQQILENSKLCV